jgi:hypothetical protein
LKVLKGLLKPIGKIKISKIFVNKRNGQMMILLPKKKMKNVPSKVEVSYW